MFLADHNEHVALAIAEATEAVTRLEGTIRRVCYDADTNRGYVLWEREPVITGRPYVIHAFNYHPNDREPFKGLFAGIYDLEGSLANFRWDALR